MYEFNQAFAASIMGGYLVLERRLPIRGLAPMASLVAAGLVAYSLTLPREIAPCRRRCRRPSS